MSTGNLAPINRPDKRSGFFFFGRIFDLFGVLKFVIIVVVYLITAGKRKIFVGYNGRGEGLLLFSTLFRCCNSVKKQSYRLL